MPALRFTVSERSSTTRLPRGAPNPLGSVAYRLRIPLYECPVLHNRRAYWVRSLKETHTALLDKRAFITC